MINGLLYIPEFITVDEEKQVLSNFEEPVRNSDKLRNNFFRYGEKTPYAKGFISKAVPEYLQHLADKIVAANLSDPPKSISVNEYLTGQIIEPHIDNVNAGPVILILSLSSAATMRFTRKSKNQFFDLELQPRSLMRMQDEARNKWKHEILPVEATRYSIVFRCV